MEQYELGNLYHSVVFDVRGVLYPRLLLQREYATFIKFLGNVSN